VAEDEVDDDMSGELATLVAAYALDAVTDDERALVESRLPSRPDLVREVEVLRSAASLLAEPVTAMPPARLRQSVLSQLGSVRQLPGAAADRVPAAWSGSVGDRADQLADQHAAATSPLAAHGGPAALPDGVVDLSARRSSRASRTAVGRRGAWRQSAAVALVAAAVAVGAVFAVQGAVRSPASSTASTLSQVVARPDARVAQVRVGASARATVAWSASERRAVVVLASLAPAPAGRTYQLWLIDRSGAVSKGVFAPSGGTAQLAVDGAGLGQAVGVTVEPAGGSAAPTTTPILRLALT